MATASGYQPPSAQQQVGNYHRGTPASVSWVTDASDDSTLSTATQAAQQVTATPSSNPSSTNSSSIQWAPTSVASTEAPSSVNSSVCSTAHVQHAAAAASASLLNSPLTTQAPPNSVVGTPTLPGGRRGSGTPVSVLGARQVTSRLSGVSPTRSHDPYNWDPFSTTAAAGRNMTPTGSTPQSPIDPRSGFHLGPALSRSSPASHQPAADERGPNFQLSPNSQRLSTMNPAAVPFTPFPVQPVASPAVHAAATALQPSPHSVPMSSQSTEAMLFSAATVAAFIMAQQQQQVAWEQLSLGTATDSSHQRPQHGSVVHPSDQDYYYHHRRSAPPPSAPGAPSLEADELDGDIVDVEADERYASATFASAAAPSFHDDPAAAILAQGQYSAMAGTILPPSFSPSHHQHPSLSHRGAGGSGRSPHVHPSGQQPRPSYFGALANGPGSLNASSVTSAGSIDSSLGGSSHQDQLEHRECVPQAMDGHGPHPHPSRRGPKGGGHHPRGSAASMAVAPPHSPAAAPVVVTSTTMRCIPTTIENGRRRSPPSISSGGALQAEAAAPSQASLSQEAPPASGSTPVRPKSQTPAGKANFVPRASARPTTVPSSCSDHDLHTGDLDTSASGTLGAGTSTMSPTPTHRVPISRMYQNGRPIPVCNATGNATHGGGFVAVGASPAATAYNVTSISHSS